MFSTLTPCFAGIFLRFFIFQGFEFIFLPSLSLRLTSSFLIRESKKAERRDSYSACMVHRISFAWLYGCLLFCYFHLKKKNKADRSDVLFVCLFFCFVFVFHLYKALVGKNERGKSKKAKDFIEKKQGQNVQKFMKESVNTLCIPGCIMHIVCCIIKDLIK